MLLRTAARGPDGCSVIFANASAGVEVAVPWFEPRYWMTRAALVASGKGRGAATIFEHGGRRFVLRHYLRGGLAAMLSRDRYLWLGESHTRPLAEMQLMLRLNAAGLPVPLPVAARYERLGTSYRADLITEFLHDTATLAERLDAGVVSPATWTAVGRCIRRFHDYGLCHADLNARNILLRGDEEVFLIDFDRAVRRKPGLWCDANLARLRRSLDALEDGRSEPGFSEEHWQHLLAGWF